MLIENIAPAGEGTQIFSVLSLFTSCKPQKLLETEGVSVSWKLNDVWLFLTFRQSPVSKNIGDVQPFAGIHTLAYDI